MLSDSNFRKTAKCSFYKSFLSTKSIPEFPIKRVPPEELDTDALIHSTGFNKPFVVTSGKNGPNSKIDALGLVLPDRDKDLTYVSEVCGPTTPVKIIEVGQQAEITEWTLGEYAQYLQNYRPDDHKVLNMITLEFSATPLNSKVQAPEFVRDLDWIDIIWPLERRARGDYPKVQKYCLAGMAGSYTDFHIDFGGTSVWYHVLTGKKRFYLVPPTTANLRAFEKWTTSSAQADVFFGDLLDPPNQCFQFELSPGETFIIPSGWIHAVYTPLDSLVFGGNFVHSYSILRQLQIYSIEHRTRVQKAYRFPFFRQINWCFLCAVLPAARALYACPGEHPGPSTTAEIDEGDDLYSIALSLKDPAVFYQLPYLVRTCELWRTGVAVEGQEKGVFEHDWKEAGYNSAEEVLTTWWGLLESIAATIDAPSVALEHVAHIRSQAALDLLDDRVVRPVFRSFEADVSALLARSAPLTATSDQITEQPATSAAAPPAGPLKLTFTLKPTQAPQPPASSPDTEPPQPKSTATASSSRSSSTVLRISNNSIIKPARPAPQRSAALKLAMPAGSRPRVNANANVEKSAQSAAVGAQRYDTRGLKLSAAYLSRTMDVDVDAGEDSAAETGLSGDEAYASDHADADENEAEQGKRRRRSTSRRDQRSQASEFVFQDRERGLAGDEEWSQQLHAGISSSATGAGGEEAEDSDATDILSDVEEGLAAARNSGSRGGGAAGDKRKRTSAIPAAVPKQHYYIDRVSEPTLQRGATALPVTAGKAVPQVPDGRSRAKAPVSNRQMIMKKLGLK